MEQEEDKAEEQQTVPGENMVNQLYGLAIR
jgi:hypothetical protein